MLRLSEHRLCNIVEYIKGLEHANTAVLFLGGLDGLSPGRVLQQLGVDRVRRHVDVPDDAAAHKHGLY